MTARPTVGANIHYVSHGTPIRDDGTQAFPSVCRTAFVTEIVREGAFGVGLVALNPTGLLFHPISDGPVKYEPPTLRAGGTWHWPEQVDKSEVARHLAGDIFEKPNVTTDLRVGHNERRRMMMAEAAYVERPAHLPDNPLEDVVTINDCAVGIRAGNITFANGAILTGLEPAKAVRCAAWIIAILEGLRPGALAEFHRALDAILKT